ncbi:MAG: hypothetical protein RXR31_08640 [Thermoproteota archaeon]
MTFISYTPLDAVGIGAGLSLLEKVTHSFWEGSFLGESLLAIFVFLSLAKIAMDSIIEHRYDRAIIDFTKIAIIILLFNVTTTATIFDARQAAMNGGITSNPTPTSTQIQIPNVPLMADIYAIPDNLAYQLASLMLNPRKTMTIDLANVVLNPLSIIDYSFDNMVYSSHDPIKMYEEFAYCYDRDAYNALRTEGKLNMSCSEFNNLWASTAKQIESQIQQQGNVNPTVLGDMNYAIDLIQSGYFQNNKAYKDAYLKHEMEALQQIAPDIEKINNSYIQTSKGNPSNNALINGIEGSINTGLNMAAFDMYHLYLPRQFMESLMMHMQEYAIAIMFLLLPFVVILGLLPIFGSNYKLIIKYAVSFFLIKLWVPILWLIYISMVNVSAILMGSAVNIEHEMRNGIQYAITTFTGNTAFAQTQQQTGNGTPPPPTPAGSPPPGSGQPYNTPPPPSSNFQTVSHEAILVKIAEEHSRLNDLILTSMYAIIPTVLGSSATYLVGKGMVDAGVAAYAEGAMLAKQFMMWGLKNAPKILEGAVNFVRGIPGAISAGWDFAKNLPGNIRDGWNGLKGRFGFGSNDENINDPTGNPPTPPTGEGNPLTPPTGEGNPLTGESLGEGLEEGLEDIGEDIGIGITEDSAVDLLELLAGLI